MKIVNICVNGIYTDGLSYQENLLPKYQCLNGDEVTVLASQYRLNEKGLPEEDKRTSYFDGILKVRRIPIKKHKNVTSRFKRFENLYQYIAEEKPDIIFCHLMQFPDALEVVRYVKNHPNTKLYFDSHADLLNSGRNWLSKHILHGIIWRYIAHKALPYTEKYYGVTPARVDFLRNVYKLPEQKVELLVMGVDDEEYENICNTVDRDALRRRIGVNPEETLIITGGKIDYNKPQVLTLMRYIRTKKSHVKLAVFGSCADAYKEAFASLTGDNVISLGWLNHHEIYMWLYAADMAVYPGLHSVLWEETVGCGIPCVFKKIQGFEHVDLSGNCVFLKDDSQQELESVLGGLLDHPDMIKRMGRAAQEKRMRFSYREIAKQSIC